MFRKKQSTSDIVLQIPLLKKDGSQATSLSLGTLATKLISPTGIAVTGYTEAVFTEPNSDGVYVCKFLSGAAILAFTLEDQANPYSVTLDSSTADVEPSTIELWIVSRYVWELALNSLMERSVGLTLENHVEDNIIRDVRGNKTSSIVYLYNSNTNAILHDGTTGLTAKYNVTVTYDSNNRMLLMKVVKV